MVTAWRAAERTSIETASDQLALSAAICREAAEFPALRRHGCKDCGALGRSLDAPNIRCRNVIRAKFHVRLYF
jgi:hypothetical protein